MRRGKRLDYRARKRRKIIIIVVIVVIVLLVAGGFAVAKSGLITKVQGVFHKDNTINESQETVLQPQETDESQAGETKQADSVSEIESLWANDTRTPTQAKGIYVTGSVAGNATTMGKLQSVIDKTELNTMIIDIKNDSGEISYQIDNSLAKKIGASKSYIRDIKSLVKQLKKKNIYLVARVVAFKDPILAAGKPSYSIHRSDGSVYKDSSGDAWVNPYNKKVWKYLVDIAKEAYDIGFDEVQYSYVRFLAQNSTSDIDYGKEAKNTSKTEIINQFIQYAYDELAPKGMYVSAEIYGASIMTEGDGESLGQNFKQMAQYLDYICPMIYPSNYVDGAYGVESPDKQPYDLVLAALQSAYKQLKGVDGHVAQIRPWLQDFSATWISNHTTYGKKQIQAQIQAVTETGLSEWMLWSPTNNYSTEGLSKSE